MRWRAPRGLLWLLLWLGHLQIHKHMLAAEYQLAAFRDAAAAARALGRALILPKMWAWCDSDQPSVLRDCTIDGAQQVAPWQAPADLFVNMDVRIPYLRCTHAYKYSNLYV